MERLFAPPDQPFWRVSTDCRPKRSNPTGSWVACSSVKSSLISSLNTWTSFGASIPSFTWDPRMDRIVTSTSSPMTIVSSAFRDNISIFSSLCWLDGSSMLTHCRKNGNRRPSISDLSYRNVGNDTTFPSRTSIHVCSSFSMCAFIANAKSSGVLRLCGNRRSFNWRILFLSSGPPFLMAYSLRSFSKETDTFGSSAKSSRQTKGMANRSLTFGRR